MFGAMPADFLLFEVGEEPPAEESYEEEDITPDPQNNWDINNRSVTRY